jgi:hypothetical protein
MLFTFAGRLEMKRIILFATLLTIVSCSATGPLFERETVETDKGVLYLYRPSKFVAGARVAKFSINGRYVARLSNNGYTWFSLPPGKFKISQEWEEWPGDISRNPEVMEIEVAVSRGENYYVRFTPTARGLVVFTDYLEQVPENIALHEIAECRHQKFKVIPESDDEYGLY